MPSDLLEAAVSHAERADRPAQAAIWLRAARVVATFDRAAAERLIERGVAAARELEPSDREPLMHTAVSMAAVVAPPLAMALAERELSDHIREGAITQAFFHMADHGLIDEAAAILSDFPGRLPFPFTGVTNVLARAKDDTTRRRILESAVRAYRRERQTAEHGRSNFGRRHFVQLFEFNWRRLTPEMALETMHELLHDALEAPDEPVHASANSVHFSSSRQHRLFEILGPLRRLDPSTADALVSAYPQLAKAAAVMPFGMSSSVMPDAALPSEPAPDRVAESMDDLDLDSMLVGDRVVPMREALATNFAAAFEIADRLFEADAHGGNAAPKEAWPSAAEYRTILFKAGRHDGRAGAGYLERVPDTDLRVLASIEFAAALAGLPQVGGITIGPGRRGVRPAEPAEPLPPEIAALIEQRRHRPLPLPARPNLPPSRDVRISPSSRPPGAGMAGGAGSDFWIMEGVPLTPVLAKIYDMPEHRIEIPPALARDRFDFALVLASDESHDTMKRLMRESINRRFQIDVVREPRERDVYVLAAPAGVKLKTALSATMGGCSIGYSRGAADDLPDHETEDLRQVMDLHMAGESLWGNGPQDGAREMMRMMARNSRGSALTSLHGDFTISAVCDALEGSLDRLVVDETGLTGSYEFRVETEATSTPAFLEALRDAAGIVATPARREVTVLVVRPARP
jgi:uncharacterized protein (TIGR03435 family)